jgi:O-antigen/teichoic acid export membrane protein
MFQTTIRGQFLIIENKQQIGLWFRVFTTMVSIGLSLLLIPRYGIVGAAFATLISYGLPIYVGSIFHPLLRLNLGMCLKSYLAPFRLLRFLLSAIKGWRA